MGVTLTIGELLSGLGFSFEGVFAQHRVVKGRNRDTAWFSLTDAQWPDVREGMTAWLDPANFDDDGRQLHSLTQCRQICAVPPPADSVVLRSERLLLRVPHPDDAPAMIDCYRRNQERLAPREPLRAPDYNTEAAWRRRICTARFDWTLGKALSLVVYARDDCDALADLQGRPIGTVAFTGVAGKPLCQCYMGYAIDADAEGRGLTTEAVRSALPAAWRWLGVERISANYALDNLASGRVLDKLGFVREGVSEGYLEINGQRIANQRTAMLRPR